MKPDINYINRLEPGDTFKNSNGELCKITEISKNSIKAGTIGRGDSYLRIYDKNGKGNPSSGNIET